MSGPTWHQPHAIVPPAWLAGHLGCPGLQVFDGTTCLAATLDAFLMRPFGYPDVAVFDASMSERAKDESLPDETDA